MTEPGGTFGLFLPLILMTLPFVFLNGFIANRKGKNVILFVIFSFIPLVAFYLAKYLISLTDASVLQNLIRFHPNLRILKVSPKLLASGDADEGTWFPAFQNESWTLKLYIFSRGRA